MATRGSKKKEMYDQLPDSYKALYKTNRKGVPTISLNRMKNIFNDFQERGEVGVHELSPTYFNQTGKQKYKRAVADNLPPDYKDNIKYNKKGIPKLSAEKLQRLTQYSSEGMPAEFGMQMLVGKVGPGGNLTIGAGGARGIAMQQMLQELSYQKYQRELMRPEILREQGYTVDKDTGKLVATEEEGRRRKYDDFLQQRQLLGVGYGQDPATGEMTKLSEEDIMDKLAPEERDAYELRRKQQKKVLGEFDMFTEQEQKRYGRSFEEADVAGGMYKDAAGLAGKGMDFAGGIFDRSEKAAGMVESRYGLIGDAEKQLKDAYGLREQASGRLEEQYGLTRDAESQLQDTYGLREQAAGQLEGMYDLQGDMQDQLRSGLETRGMAEGRLQDVLGMQQTSQGELMDAMGQRRQASGQLSDFYGARGAAQGQLMQSYGQMAGGRAQLQGIRGMAAGARQDYMSTSGRVQDLLAGKGEVSAGLEHDLTEQEKSIRERLRRQYGPNYENTTGGFQALQQFKTQSNIARDSSRREQLPAAVQTMQSLYGAGVGAGTGEAYGQAIGAGTGEMFQQAAGAGSEALYQQASGQGLGQLYGQTVGAGTGELAGQAGGQNLGQLYGGAMGAGSGEMAQQAFGGMSSELFQQAMGRGSGEMAQQAMGGMTSELFQQSMGRGSEELYRQSLGWGAGQAAEAGMGAMGQMNQMSTGGAGGTFYGRHPQGAFMGTDQFKNEANLYGAISGNQAPQMTGVLSSMPTYGGEGAANVAQNAYAQNRGQNFQESQLGFDQWYKRMDVEMRDKGLNIQALQGTPYGMSGGGGSSGGGGGILGMLGSAGIGALGTMGAAAIMSDKRLKKNIKPVHTGMHVIKKLRPVTFTWKYTDSEDVGLIAQEVEQVLPEAVTENSNGTKMLQPLTLIGILIKAVQELKEEIDSLKEGS